MSRSKDLRAFRPDIQRSEISLPILGYSLFYTHCVSGQGFKAYGWRNYYVLIWCKSGILEAKVGDRVHYIRESQAMILPGKTHVGIRAEKNGVCLMLKFEGKYALDILKEYGLKFENAYDVGSPPLPLIDRYFRALEDMTSAGVLRACTCTLELITEIATRGLMNRMDPLVYRAIQLIQSCWSDVNFDVNHLALELGRHRSLLSRRFKEQVGIGPGEYLRQQRLQQAVSLLEEGGLSTKEIAARCGHADATSFTRSIRKMTGMTPGQIRKHA